MADSQRFLYGLKSTKILCQTDELIKKSIIIEGGNPARYRLQSDNLDQLESYRKITFGKRDTDKPHKIILMVGETGTGKTTLINTMINYSCGVQRKHKVWFEITDEINRSSAHSQTSDVTVYGVYLQETSVDLTIIDTPGYGDTRDKSHDKEIARKLLRLCMSVDMISEIDAVCFVVMAHKNRLSDRQHYIFDAVQSLFGRDIGDNIVLLFTHSDGLPPKNALTAVKAAKVKCAVDEKNQPIYFLFNNCQGETLEEEHQSIQHHSWDLSFRGMTEFFKFLDRIHSKTLKTTEHVLEKRQQLEGKISKLHSCIEKIVQNSKQKEKNKNFEFEVKVPYKEKVDINTALAYNAMCCTVCEENCHYPGCGWFCYLLGCSMMKNNQCAVCTKKCHPNKHIREAKIYETKTKTETKINDVKKQNFDKLEKELQELEKEKVKRVMDVFHCVETLEMIALNTESLFMLQHIDFLIEKLKEIKEPEKAEHLKKH